MAAVAGALLAAVLATAAAGLFWLRRGGAVPYLRLLCAAAAGASVAGPIAVAGRALGGPDLVGRVAAGPMSHLGLLLGGGCLLAGAIALGAMASSAGDRLASPSAGVGLGVCVALGVFAVSLAALGAPGPRDPGVVALEAAVLGATGAAVGSLTGAAKMRAHAGEKAALISLGVAAGTALLAGGTVAAVELIVSGTSWGPGTLAAGGLAVTAGVVTIAWRWEGRALVAELREEADLGVIPRELVAALASLAGSGAARWWPRRDERRTVVSLLGQLALRKHYLRQLAGDHARIYSLEVGRLRERVRRALRPPDSPDPDQDSEG